MPMTQEQKDGRRAERINRRRMEAWKAETGSLFETNAPPAPLTARSVTQKRAHDELVGQAALAKVAALEERTDVQADLMRALFGELTSPYLADIRENSLPPYLRKYRWGYWEKHLHSIGVVVVGVLESGETCQVTAARADGMAIWEPLLPANAPMLGKKK